MNGFRKKSQNEGFEEKSTGASAGVGDKAREFLENLRYFRVFIGIWNIAMLACMFMLVEGAMKLRGRSFVNVN